MLIHALRHFVTNDLRCFIIFHVLYKIELKRTSTRYFSRGIFQCSLPCLKRFFLESFSFCVFFFLSFVLEIFITPSFFPTQYILITAILKEVLDYNISVKIIHSTAKEK